jgi:hypothetical protein
MLRYVSTILHDECTMTIEPASAFLNLVHLQSPSLAFKTEIPPHCTELFIKRARVVSYFLVILYLILCLFDHERAAVGRRQFVAEKAIAEFLTSIHPLLPPYWYKLQCDDVGSLAFLFGLSEVELEALFLRPAGHLEAKKEKSPIPKEYCR